MRYLDKFRSNISRLFDAYVEATGYRHSTVAQMVARDPKFYGSFQARDMRVGTYDIVTARFSAIWPEDLPWPGGIERPAPAVDDDAPVVRSRAQRQDKQKSVENDWPADKPWPADIPRPVQTPMSATGEL